MYEYDYKRVCRVHAVKGGELLKNLYRSKSFKQIREAIIIIVRTATGGERKEKKRVLLERVKTIKPQQCRYKHTHSIIHNI